MKINRLTDKHIAQAILDIISRYYKSWDGAIHTHGRLWADNVEPFLKLHSSYSPFALALLYFGWQQTNDVQDICMKVIERNL